MLENITQSKYSDAVDSYTALNVSSKIRGTLIEKEDKNIKIDIGNNQALDIELREDVSIKKGDTVLIDRRNIVKSKVVDLDVTIKIENDEIDIYSETLKNLDVDISEENIKIIKKLDNYGIDITKENFETYVIAKNSLDDIASSLDYESTIKLIEMDVDIENESIQKLASLIEGLEEEKEGFNILKMFKKKELTTDEAEDIAKKLYGSKMGKDIVDIIKSLHKNKVNITKKNIEKIDDVFYKLDKLKDIEDKTFVDTIKNKLDINIDNLYKTKIYVKDDKVNVETNIVDDRQIINIRGYGVTTQTKPKVTNKDLRLLEEDIKDLMIDIELEPSQDNIKLSKEFIKRNMNVTKENIVSIDEMKNALKVIIQDLDQEVAAQLIKENVDIESTDIRVIVEKIKTIKNPENKVSSEVKLNDIELPVIEKVDDVEEIKELKQEIIKSIETIENKMSSEAKIKDSETLAIETTVDVEKPQKLQTNENLFNQEVPNLEQENVNNIMGKIQSLKKVDEKDILTLLEKNVDFKISKIEQVIFGKGNPVSINKIEDVTYSASIKPQDIKTKDTIQGTLDGIDKISTAFREIGKLNFNIIAFQMKRNIPMTLTNMQKSSKYLDTNNILNQDNQGYENENQSAIQALNKNVLEASRLNIQKSMEAYRSYNNIKENLTSNMVKDAVVNNIKIEDMDITLASKYVDQYRKSSLNYDTTEQIENVKQKIQYEKQVDTEKYAHIFTENAHEIIKNSDENIIFLVKNKKPFSFKQLKETHSMFKNENQIGHKILEMEDLLHKSGDDQTKQKFKQLKKDILDISRSMKGSKNEVEEAYRRVEESVKDIEDNMKFLNQDNDSLIRKKSKEISEKIDESKIIAKDNGIIQFPLYMNGQFTNLNMYFRDKQRDGSKRNSEDISVVLSIDTVNMGNLNINLDIEKKNINIKIGLENLDDKSHIESHKNMLVEFLEQGGYSTGEISFYKEGEEDTFIKENISKEKPSIAKGNLDLKI